MATVKFHEGTKIETSVNLEDGEGIIFVRPQKHGIYRDKGMTKTWEINLVLTDRRLIAIPVPPNKKNKQVESYYFTDIAEAVKKSSADEQIWAYFFLKMKDGGKSTYEEGGTFDIRVEMNFKNTFGRFFKELGAGMVNQFQASASDFVATAQTMENKHEAERTGASHYTVVSPQYSGIASDTRNKDYSQMGQNQIRDYIVDVINQCVEAANA